MVFTDVLFFWFTSRKVTPRWEVSSSEFYGTHNRTKLWQFYLSIGRHSFRAVDYYVYMHTFIIILTSEVLPTKVYRNPGICYEFPLYIHIYVFLFITWNECLLVYVGFYVSRIALPHKVKTQYLHLRSHLKYFLLSWKIPEVICRWWILFHN